MEAVSKLNEYDFKKFACDSIVCLVGKRNTGKSVTLEYFLWRIKDKVQLVLVQSSSEEFNNHFKKFIPHCFIVDGKKLNFELIQNFFDKIGQAKKDLGKGL